MIDQEFTHSRHLSGRGSARAEDARGTPTKNHPSPSILEYEKITPPPPPGSSYPTILAGAPPAPLQPPTLLLPVEGGLPFPFLAPLPVSQLLGGAATAAPTLSRLEPSTIPLPPPLGTTAGAAPSVPPSVVSQSQRMSSAAQRIASLRQRIAALANTAQRIAKAAPGVAAPGLGVPGGAAAAVNQHPWIQTLYPKPQTPHPKPQTLNPKP